MGSIHTVGTTIREKVLTSEMNTQIDTSKPCTIKFILYYISDELMQNSMTKTELASDRSYWHV